jgi:hypothetical protein
VNEASFIETATPLIETAIGNTENANKNFIDADSNTENEVAFSTIEVPCIKNAIGFIEIAIAFSIIETSFI